MRQALKGADSPDLKKIDSAIVADFTTRKTAIPGIGHSIHKPIDPRSPRLFQLAKENGYYGNYCELIQLIAAEAERVLDKPLPVNATGAIAIELGFNWRICRGIAIIGRGSGPGGTYRRGDPQSDRAGDLQAHRRRNVGAYAFEVTNQIGPRSWRCMLTEQVLRWNTEMTGNCL